MLEAYLYQVPVTNFGVHPAVNEAQCNIFSFTCKIQSGIRRHCRFSREISSNCWVRGSFLKPWLTLTLYFRNVNVHGFRSFVEESVLVKSSPLVIPTTHFSQPALGLLGDLIGSCDRATFKQKQNKTKIREGVCGSITRSW